MIDGNNLGETVKCSDFAAIGVAVHATRRDGWNDDTTRIIMPEETC